MTKSVNTTQTKKVLNFLTSGQSLSEAQAVKMFGIKSVGARVAELREAGFPVYTNVTKTGKTVYRLGPPSRAMIAAAYTAAGATIFK